MLSRKMMLHSFLHNQHSGTCVDRVASYRCLCPPHYTGTRCEQHTCDLTPPYCAQTGTCEASAPDGSPVCVCERYYHGDRCENHTCQVVPGYCGPNGTCVNRGGVPDCVCDPYWSGKCAYVRACVHARLSVSICVQTEVFHHFILLHN